MDELEYGLLYNIASSAFMVGFHSGAKSGQPSGGIVSVDQMISYINTMIKKETDKYLKEKYENL